MTENRWGGYDYRQPPGYPPREYNYPQAPSAGEALSRYSRKSSPQNTGLAGRVVESPRDIMPDEVPMNGSLALFPMKDLSVIYAKAWTDHGIDTVPYVPEQPVQTQPAPNAVYIPEEFKADVFGRLDKIEQALAALAAKPTSKKKEEQPNG